MHITLVSYYKAKGTILIISVRFESKYMGSGKSEIIDITHGGVSGKVAIFIQKNNPSFYEKNILPSISLVQDFIIKPLVKKEIEKNLMKKITPFLRLLKSKR